MVPAAAYGQLTTAPVPVVVPVFPGWSLTLLTLAIALLFVAGLSRRSRAGRSFTAGAAAIVACLAAWESPALK
ncbi:MAG TPA: hypothetical protein VJ947_08110, partial [Pseudohaliea sp.]|nr:hypothetical protein [Pseudohaliea sp.]